MRVMRRTVTRRRCLALVAGVAAASQFGVADGSFPGPDGQIGQSALVRGHKDIVTVAPDGSGERDLTPHRGHLSFIEPSFSANGRIAAEGVKPAPPGVPATSVQMIYTMHADGSHRRRITDGPEDTDPAFSRDGKTIVYARRGRLYAMRADGSHRRRITPPRMFGQFPVFSPDGSWIAFSCSQFGRIDGGQICSVRSDGSRVRVLTANRFGSLPGSSVNVFPDISPDGREILFTSQGRILVMNADGSQLRVLSTFDEPLEAAFSPDGKQIAFFAEANGPYLGIMNVDGTQPHRLVTHSRLNFYGLTWTPARPAG